MVSEESVGLDGMGQEALKGIHSGAELGEVAKGNMERLEAVVVMEFFSGVCHSCYFSCSYIYTYLCS